jgi:hypothetical protein
MFSGRCAVGWAFLGIKATSAAEQLEHSQHKGVRGHKVQVRSMAITDDRGRMPD